MNVFRVVTGNYIINVGFLSWFLAQVIKLILTLVATRRVELERLVGSGGMPSSHSSFTAAIAIGMARKMGYTSPEFGLAIALAAIVMYDAMGVRRAAGEQAKVLNKLVFSLPWHKNEEVSENDGEQTERQPIMERELKEYIGHTPMEVLGGCLLGILVAVFMPVK